VSLKGAGTGLTEKNMISNRVILNDLIFRAKNHRLPVLLMIVALVKDSTSQGIAPNQA
jgi:hypothetical protein